MECFGNLNYNKNEITKLFNGLDEYTLPDTGLKMKGRQTLGRILLCEMGRSRSA